MTALGGTPPYRWRTNSASGGLSGLGRALRWLTEGGQHRELVVIDSTGAEASGRVFIDARS